MKARLNRGDARLVTFLAISCFFQGNLSAKEFPAGIHPGWSIPEGETLVYAMYEGKQKRREIRMVSVSGPDRNEAKIYFADRALDAVGLPPVNYRDYPSYFIVDLDKGSVVRYHEDNYDYNVKQKGQHGIFYWDIAIHGSDIIKRSRSLDTDGIHDNQYSVRNVDSGYPIWTVQALLFYGVRIIDWEKGGSLLTIVPEDRSVWKSHLVVVDPETIETPAGGIQTIKLQWRASNFFLDLLMRVFYDPLYIWIEKGGSHRVIKTSYGNQIALLVATSVAR